MIPPVCTVVTGTRDGNMLLPLLFLRTQGDGDYNVVRSHNSPEVDARRQQTTVFQ